MVEEAEDSVRRREGRDMGEAAEDRASGEGMVGGQLEQRLGGARLGTGWQLSNSLTTYPMCVEQPQGSV